MKTSAADQLEVASIPGFKRVNYVQGQLLSVEDFRREQSYLIDKLRQQNRASFKPGVIKGLDVNCSGQRVSISPGFAMDTSGRLIELAAACEFELPARRGIWDIVVELIDEQCDPAPSLNVDATEGGQQFSAICEVVKIRVSRAPKKRPKRSPKTCVLVARINAQNGSREAVSA